MNPEAQEVLKKILAKDLNVLTPHDIDFLKARWGYVDRNNRKKFESIFKLKTKEVEKPESPEVPPGPHDLEDGQVE